MSWFDGLLQPIMVVVAWIMVQFHSLFFAIGMDRTAGRRGRCPSSAW